jgi:hypothetical protein
MHSTNGSPMSAITKIIDSLVDTAAEHAPSFLAKTAAVEIRKQRLRAGAERLQKEMRNGRPWAFRDDEVASLTFDYLRAAEDGCAKENLRVMAQLVANGVAEQSITEEEVRHLLRVIAGLSFGEMRATAAFVRALKESRSLPLEDPSEPFARITMIWQSVWRQLSPAGAEAATEEAMALCGALQRTGFVAAYSGYGGLVFAASPLLAQLENLVEFHQ